MKKVFLFSLLYLLSVVTVVAQQKDNKQQVQKQRLKTVKYHQGTALFWKSGRSGRTPTDWSDYSFEGYRFWYYYGC